LILSVSRRTDIPAFYSDWFYNRIKEGKVYVRNPMNPHKISSIALSPDNIDCIVFWTKNPSDSFISNLIILDDLKIPYYFQFTITSYNQTIECNVPKKNEIIEKFIKLSQKVGKEKIIWRYDPIFFNETYTLDYHKKYFTYLLEHLYKYTNKCIFSYFDFYKKIKKNIDINKISQLNENDEVEIASYMAKAVNKYNLSLETCCEKINLQLLGIKKGHCIDSNLINKITNKNFNLIKDKNQRSECGCAESIDIGAYNTCKHNCIYCYANCTNINTNYNPNSLLLCSEIEKDDIISERKIKKLNLFKNELPFD